MLTCPICDCWVLPHQKVCSECDKIRQLCKIYGKEKLLEILDKTMVIQQHREPVGRLVMAQQAQTISEIKELRRASP